MFWIHTIHSFFPIFQTPIAAQTSIHWSGIERVFPNPSNPWMSTWWSSFKIPRSELKSTICSDKSVFVSNAKGFGITKLFWSIYLYNTFAGLSEMDNWITVTFFVTDNWSSVGERIQRRTTTNLTKHTFCSTARKKVIVVPY